MTSKIIRQIPSLTSMTLSVLLTHEEGTYLICGKISSLQREIYNLYLELHNITHDNEKILLKKKLDDFCLRSYIHHQVIPSQSENIDLTVFRNELALMIKFFRSRLNSGVPINKTKNYLQKKKNSDRYLKLLTMEYGNVNSLIYEIKLRYPNEWKKIITNEIKFLEIEKTQIQLNAINEYRQLVEKKFKTSFYNNGGVKGLNISNRNYANLRRILLELKGCSRKANILHPTLGYLPMPLLPGPRYKENQIKKNIIRLVIKN